MHRIVHRLVVVAAVAGCSSVGPMTSPARADGNAAPSFAMRGLDGRMTRLTDLRGRPVVLDFWATWCRPCRASMPHLDVMQTRYRTQGLSVIGASIDEGGPEPVKQFAQRLGVHFKLTMADSRVLDDYGPIRSVPTTFFIDRRGQIVRRVVGYIDEETLETYVKEIL